jgi:hypothetical protein
MPSINIALNTVTGQRIVGLLPENFELNDLLKVIRDKVGDTAVENFRFICKGKQLLLDDPVAFKNQKHLITDEVTIQVAKRLKGGMSSGYPRIHELVDRILDEVGIAFDKMSRQLSLQCAICLDKLDPCTKIVCIKCTHVNIVCKDDFVQHFKEDDLAFKCLKCLKIIENKQVFVNSPAFLKLLTLLKEMREMKQNIDCQICVCGEFQVRAITTSFIT